MPRSSTPAPDPAGRLLGAHQSIAGGHARAVERAVETGCTCLQIFTGNVNRWDNAALAPEAAAAFRAAVTAAGLGLVVAHDSYLINPAAADDRLRNRSIDALVEELGRAEQLGIPWLVIHPGAAGEQDRDTAVARAADGIVAALGRTAAAACGILVETTAGQGTCLGASFAEIGAILARGDDAGLTRRIGVCLDTCHVFAAGYALAPAAELAATLGEFDDHVGLDRLVVIHANDSKKPRGSRVDRHEAIGDGCIGAEGFRSLLAEPRLARIPLILETPKEGPDGKPDPAVDRRNLAALRALDGGPAARRQAAARPRRRA
ncbi:MAG: deoxyribonuclease IV [Planctomycetes bacterium]|nr:deoxyribonuclease IV [Planctomycetota bacterium]